MLTKKRYLPVIALAAAMLVLVTYAVWNQSGELLDRVRFIDTPRDQVLDLHYDAQDDSYILVLPGYAETEDVTAVCPTGLSVRYNGRETLADISMSQNVELVISAPLRSQKVNLRLESAGALPSVFVEAEEGVIPYLNADKNNTRDVVVRILDEKGQPMLQSTASMYGRGNGSWDSPSKKPYNLEFPREVSFGPFESITKLAMLAEFSDESKLRNSLAYYAGQELGVDYASPYQYASLYVNGEYLGLYGLVTKQVYKNHLAEDSIQAVFEIASGENWVEFYSDLGWRINVMHGSKTTVQALVGELEAALMEEDWERTAAIIDVDSFAQKYALEEFLANLDLSYASQYFYLHTDGKIHCMLPWDYDWTLGSSYSYFNNRQVNELKVRRDDNSWYARLLQQEPFRAAVVSALETQFDDGFLKRLEDHLLSDIGRIAPAWHSDRLRWENELPYNGFDLASGITTLDGFGQAFRAYFYARRDFLADYYGNQEDYRQLTFVGAQWGKFMLPKGTDLEEYLDGATILDVYTPGERFLGWFTLDEDPADFSITLDEKVTFVGHYEELETGKDLQSLMKTILIQYGWGIFMCLVFGILCAAMLWMEWKRNDPKWRIG